MAVTAQKIVERVRQQLIDVTTPYRWSDSELFYWISDAQRAIVAAIPFACYKVLSVAMVPGTRQFLPEDGYKVLDIPRNLTAGGVAGSPCVRTERDVLDRQNLAWHTASPQASVLHWSYNSDDPLSFFVYPANNGFGAVEMVYSCRPDDVAQLTDVITVRPIYETAILDYVLYRAHQKDSDFAAGMERAGAYLQAFTAFLQAQAGGRG